MSSNISPVRASKKFNQVFELTEPGKQQQHKKFNQVFEVL